MTKMEMIKKIKEILEAHGHAPGVNNEWIARRIIEVIEED